MNEIHVSWEWPLESEPAAIWPLVADTDRFNADSGVPNIEQLGQDEYRRTLRLTKLGVTVEWEEEPFEWVRPERFGVVRRYKQGPLEEMRVLAELTADPRMLRYQVWARPRNWLVAMAVRVQLIESGIRFGKTVKAYDEAAARGRRGIEVRGPVRLASGGTAVLERARRELLAARMSEDLVSRLCLLVQHGDDFDVHRMRPYALAREWNADRRSALELCLRAVGAGLLEARWVLLCPLCRGAKQTAGALGEVDPRVHCDACNIDFPVDMDRSMELVFAPNATVRNAEVASYCFGGPQRTPHIVMQQIVAPGESRTVRPVLEAATYRLRRWGRPGGRLLRVSDGVGSGEAVLDGEDGPEMTVGFRQEFTLRHTCASAQVMILERLAWHDDAATAAEVTSLQVFRDLFPDETPRPFLSLPVEELTVLFTDVVDSTGLYRRLGDALAVSRLLQQQKLVAECVEAEGGAVVKTVGDRVMAVFRSPLGAVRTGVQLQRTIEGRVDPMRLRVGMHRGPAVTVTLNDRLDYFGETVNVAAQLCAASDGRRTLASADVLNDGAVASWLATQGIVVEQDADAGVRHLRVAAKV